MTVRVEVVRVFTSPAGEFGNPLGVVAATATDSTGWQRLAAQLGFSETVFVEPAADGVAAVRIFTPTTELPFAGHPSVGTAWWLANQGTPVTALVVSAGAVAVSYDSDLTWVRARAEWAPEFVFHEFASAADVAALDPAAFTADHHYAWAWTGAGAIRSRMFAPDLGIAEDEATGAAAVRITARLGTSLTITQGQGSQLLTRHEPDGWVQLGGRVAAAQPRDVELAT